MPSPRSRKKFWIRSSLLLLFAFEALEAGFLQGAAAFFSIVGLLGILGLYVWQEGWSVALARRALLPLLFLLGLASFLHFSLLPFWILQPIVLLSLWLLFELYWKARAKYEDSLVYVTAFLLSLAAWDLAVRNLGPFWLLLVLFSLAFLLLGAFRLSALGEPLKLALAFGFFLAINLAEIFFILGFWPVSVPVKAVILLLAFYLQLSLLLAAESGKVSLKKALSPIIITVLITLIIFLTTEWYPFV